MSEKLSIKNSILEGSIKCDITIHDAELIGKNAMLEIVSKVKVKDSRPVNDSSVIYRKDFVIQSLQETLILDLNECQFYTYRGKKINIDIIMELSIDDSIFFDTSITERIQEDLLKKPKVSNTASSIIDPTDAFNFIENIKAIPFNAKITTLGLSFIGIVLIIINTLIGYHDQTVPEVQTWFYSHYNSDGETTSPFINSLIGSGSLGAFVWYLMKIQLRKYMSFFFRKSILGFGKKEEIYKVADVIGGKSRVDLENVSINIVACNIEKGQYTRGSGKKTRTESFEEPVRAVLLFTEKIDFIPKGEDISNYIKGTFSFNDMYKVLYPPQEISSSHGLIVYWEVQLIHNRFIDQELVGESSIFTYKDFLEA